MGRSIRWFFPSKGLMAAWGVFLFLGASGVQASTPNAVYLSSHDIGAVGLAGSSSYNSSTQTFTVSGSGADIWTTADAFQYDSQPTSGDCSITAEVTTQQNTNSWAKAGVMIRETTGAGATNAAVLLTPGNGVAFQYRTATGASSTNVNITGVAAPYWVRLTRAGNVFTGYYSPDGVNWSSTGAGVTLPMAANATAGLAVSAHDTTQVSSATFTNLTAATGVPNAVAFSGQDIGAVGVAGSSSYDSIGATFSVNGSGSSIAGTADSFRFLSQPTSGNCSIIAQITGVPKTGGGAQAGVMIRESSAPGASEAAVVLTPGTGLSFISRTGTGAAATSVSVGGINAPYWVQLSRTGNSFQGSYSIDGNTWTPIGSAVTIGMASNANIGLAVTSGNSTQLGTGTFAGVSAQTGVPTGLSLSSQDIGAVAYAGSSSYNSSARVFSMNGSGADIWTAADAFQYLSQPTNGDCSISAEVTGLTATNPYAKAGVMIRETAGAGATNASVLVTSSEGIAFQVRTSTGASTSTVITTGLATPYWVNLTRVGNVFQGNCSPDGNTWTQIGSPVTLTMASTATAGLAVTAHDNTKVATGTFASVNITANPLIDWVNWGNARLDDRLNFLMGQMTNAQKMQILRATSPNYWSGQGISALGIPAPVMVDAGQGVRGGNNANNGNATLFASGVLMASTWDTNLVQQVGAGIGAEARNKGPGAQVVLGPGVNIHRTPMGGRNGEYFSEDPYLSSRMAVNFIEGMQSMGVAACVKHYDCNNEEVDRGSVSVVADERTMREIYLSSFEAAMTEANSWSLMAAYNQVRGVYMTGNSYLLTNALRGDWGSNGCAISDWGSVHIAGAVYDAGLDLDMDDGAADGTDPTSLQTDLTNGTITQADLNRASGDILRLQLRTGQFDPQPAIDSTQVNSAAHDALSQQVANEGIVLLKNANHLLPLTAGSIHSIALIGPSVQSMQLGAAGSAGVTPNQSTQPYAGIQAALGSGVAINYVLGTDTSSVVPASVFTLPNAPTQPGLQAQYFNNATLSGTPTVVETDPNINFTWTGSPVAGVGSTNFSVRWTGTMTPPSTGSYVFTCSADDGCRVYINDTLIIDHWLPNAGTPYYGAIRLVQGTPYDFRVEYFQGSGGASINLQWVNPGDPVFAQVASAAAASDVAVVCVNTSGTEGEGTDRTTLHLLQGQEAMISAAVDANPRTIVVLNNGTPIDMSQWINDTPAVLESWFPGQEGGKALASILFGTVNPSGKLPDTLAVHREDYPDYANYPGSGANDVENYAEGIYVGYRSFDKKNVAPLFPFGFGLSYTTFSYANARLSSPQMAPNGSVQASVDITNTGGVAGTEVVELYVNDPNPKIDKAVRELKGFARVTLNPGQTGTAMMTLTPRSLAYCDVPNKQWKADAGTYNLQIGASSRDIRQTVALQLTGDFTQALPNLQAVSTATGILIQPVTEVAAVGQPATLSVTPSGGSISYQWELNGSAIAGATGFSYTVPSVAAGNPGSYSVVVTNPMGSVTSTAIDVIAIAAQPVSQTAALGQSATFSVGGAGALSYQWELNGLAIAGATGSSYTIASVSAANAGSYSVLVTDANGNSGLTQSATLSIVAANAVATDTPTMPTWGLILLATLLLCVGAPLLPEKRKA